MEKKNRANTLIQTKLKNNITRINDVEIIFSIKLELLKQEKNCYSTSWLILKKKKKSLGHGLEANIFFRLV